MGAANPLFHRSSIEPARTGKGGRTPGCPDHEQPKPEPEQHGKCTDSGEDGIGNAGISSGISGCEERDKAAGGEEGDDDGEEKSRDRHLASVRDARIAFGTSDEAPGKLRAAIGASHQRRRGVLSLFHLRHLNGRMKNSGMATLCFWLLAGLVIGAPGQAIGMETRKPRLGLHAVIPEIRNSRQLIVVTTRGWNDAKATVQLFARRKGESAAWQAVGKPFPAMIGAHGFGWGIGLHGTGEPEAPCKVEGDRRAPAGVFKLYSAFGLASPERVRFLRFPYRQVTLTTEAVDDPRSKYYNRIVNRELVARPDWSTSESMQRVGGRYRFGVMVEHNWRQLPGYGSCIFLHLWGGADQGTSGCTAMGPSDLNRVLHWLDARQDPLLVQLPLGEYDKRRASWDLPALKAVL